MKSDFRCYYKNGFNFYEYEHTQAVGLKGTASSVKIHLALFKILLC